VRCSTTWNDHTSIYLAHPHTTATAVCDWATPEEQGQATHQHCASHRLPTAQATIAGACKRTASRNSCAPVLSQAACHMCASAHLCVSYDITSHGIVPTTAKAHTPHVALTPRTYSLALHLVSFNGQFVLRLTTYLCAPQAQPAYRCIASSQLHPVARAVASTPDCVPSS
jgi:hypothetical protein